MMQEMMRFWGWQWHQLDQMQTICTSLQTDNHTNTSQFFTGRMLLLTPNQQCQGTEGSRINNNNNNNHLVALQLHVSHQSVPAFTQLLQLAVTMMQ